MRTPIRYVKPTYLPKCDACGSNIIPPEKYYFVGIDGHAPTDVRVVHRCCYEQNKVAWQQMHKNV